MEGEEEPAVVDLDLEVWEADLVVCAIAIGAVDVGLLSKVAWIVVREGFHERNGFGVFVNVGLVYGLSRRPNAEPGRRGELEVYDFGVCGRAAIGG